jgi:XTP/dITP diphosphohydrolase
MRQVVVASGNPGKLAEIRELLRGTGVECVPQSALGITPAAETGASFRENALLKARQAARAAGLPAIADDSGLEVEALGGRPGVLSARYAGEGATDDENVERLLAELEAVRGVERRARFRCVAVLVDAAGADPLVAEGEWQGVILTERRGSGGFGYDPVFFDPLLGKSAAELSADEKNRVSHRGRAVRELVRLMIREARP